MSFERAALAPEHLAGTSVIRHQMEAKISGLAVRGVAGGYFHVTDPDLTAAALLMLANDLVRSLP